MSIYIDLSKLFDLKTKEMLTKEKALMLAKFCLLPENQKGILFNVEPLHGYCCNFLLNTGLKAQFKSY